MTTDTLTLTAFLLARIEEDEAVTRETLADMPRWDEAWAEGVDADSLPGARLTARYSPARVLAECKAKRAIVEREHVECSGHPGPYQPHGDYGPGYCWREDEGNATLLDLAAVYADHDDYRTEWAS